MDKSGIWLLTIFRHFYGAVTLQRYDRAMLEQRIEQQFIDSADLKYQAAQGRDEAGRLPLRCGGGASG